MEVSGREFLSNLKLYSDYLKWKEDLGRYETWEEGCDAVLNTHQLKYGEKINPLIEEIKPHYYAKDLLASQRNLQFRGEHVLKHNPRLYNCCTSYCYTPDIFGKGFYILLCGTGLGVSMRQKYVKHLPNLDKREKNGTLTYVIEDSIQGWADALHVLISSFCKHKSLNEDFYGWDIKFDYSNIRPKGAFISGGFKAPGPEGLKQSLERIENLINSYLGTEKTKEFKSIIAYDIFMHASDAVLSGGVRRSAMNILIDEEDEELIGAKIGNWRETHPWRARSNNSVGLIKGEFKKTTFKKLIKLNQGDNDIGFVFSTSEDEIFNPCFEIGFNFYDKIEDPMYAAFQFCNLNEISASACIDKKGNFSEEKFYKLCRVASILGTLQAGYTDFPFINKQTENIVAGEALLGISITGWMTRPELLNAEILKKGAEIVKKTNSETAKILGINPAARTTTVKPSGNASVILKTASGIHPEHSRRYFRVMQLNKESETAKWLERNIPSLLEESVWSNTKSDYVVFVPFENSKETLVKEDMQGIKHLEVIKFVQENWINPGKRVEYCYEAEVTHNVSNTVIIDNFPDIIDYIFENQLSFSAVSFLDSYGDKQYNQAPNTSVLTTEELIKEYGDGVMFTSGLIVDGLHYFNNNLWEATDAILNKNLKIGGSRVDLLLKKDWIKKAKRFAKNYFDGDLDKLVFCMKDVHLWHKWNTISREDLKVDFTKILTKPEFKDISDYAAVACSGGQCEI